MSKVSTKLLRKKDYVTLKKALLKKNSIHPIYQDWKNQQNLLGYAKLNNKVSKPKQELSFERVSIGHGAKNEGDMIIYKHQRWNVTYVDPWEFDSTIDQKTRWQFIHRVGFTHEWNLAYFEIISSNYKS